MITLEENSLPIYKEDIDVDKLIKKLDETDRGLVWTNYFLSVNRDSELVNNSFGIPIIRFKLSNNKEPKQIVSKMIHQFFKNKIDSDTLRNGLSEYVNKNFKSKLSKANKMYIQVKPELALTYKILFDWADESDWKRPELLNIINDYDNMKCYRGLSISLSDAFDDFRSIDYLVDMSYLIDININIDARISFAEKSLNNKKKLNGVDTHSNYVILYSNYYESEENYTRLSNFIIEGLNLIPDDEIAKRFTPSAFVDLTVKLSNYKTNYESLSELDLIKTESAGIIV